MHAQVVRGVDASRPHATVMAGDAFVFAMATCAECGIVGGDVLVSSEKIRVMLCIMHPSRGKEPARRKCRRDACALGVARREVARFACPSGIASCRGIRMLMAAKASAHAGQLLARGETDLLNGAVALRAADVPGGMLLMIEDEVGRGYFKFRDAVSVTRLVAEMTRGAGTKGLFP